MLRREGLYHSHVKEWARARDAGALSGLAGARRSTRSSKGSAKDRGEVDRLRAQNVRLTAQLTQTRTALDIVGLCRTRHNPLVTNDTHLTDAEVLVAYRYQPNLERRHHLLTATQHADPVLLRNPARIEALFCCHFLALLIGALIERQIRTAMMTASTRDIPLYPELRACPAPSAERLFEIFTDLTRHELRRDGSPFRASRSSSAPSNSRSSTYSASPPPATPPCRRIHDRWGRILPARSAEREMYSNANSNETYATSLVP